MKKVLLLPDTRGWAYDVIAKNIAPYFTRYQPTIKYVGDILNKKDTVDYNNYDVVMGFFWYDMLSLGPKIYKNYNPKKTCVGIHGHNSWIKRKIKQEDAVKMVAIYPGIGCISQKLINIFKHANPIFTPSGYASNFLFKDLVKSEKMIFMWVGDPKVTHHGDIKGYNDIIRPVFDSRRDAELVIATKESKIPYDKMHEFYYQGNVYICMSQTEGSPLPIIEAMACGRPVISTNVGIAPELINSKNGYLIGRSKEELNRAINNVIANANNLPIMGREARSSVEERTWEYSALSYEKLFDRVM